MTGQRDAARDQPATLANQREQLAILLEVCRAAASLELPDLIERVALAFRQSRQWDHTGLCLYDPEVGALRPLSIFAAPGPLTALHASTRPDALIPIEGTTSGRAFTTGEPCVINSRAEIALMSPRWGSKILDIFPPAFSSCAMPLVCRGQRLGTLSAACVRDGAFDAHAVRLLREIAEVIAPAVGNALAYREIKELEERLVLQPASPGDAGSDLSEIVGDSEALRQVLALIESVAATDSTVLVQGETGTGKELVARALHRLSARSDSPFVKLNCAAIPTGLLESELFGHEKGAFTSAVSQKLGRFELAGGGTLFLDEVGEIPLELQPKLLRVLQEREFERLGGTRTIKVDVRLIAATNRDLAAMAAEGTFRNDLYYRLNVFPISVPPLRQRRQDIPRLVHHFVERSARRLGKVITVIPAAIVGALSGYHWPGNVRELENVIERSVILSPGPELQLPAGLDLDRRRPDEPAASAAPLTLAEAERAFIVQALEDTSWVVGGSSGAAARLNLSRTTLQARMRKLGIFRPR